MQLGERRLLRQVGEPRAEVRLAGGVAQHVGAVRADRAADKKMVTSTMKKMVGPEAE